MSLIAIIVAIVLAFLAFKFVKGMIKFGIIAIILLLALWLASGGIR
jgi:uncharacterized membrane protein YqaE (UPF0057 family)